MKINLKRLPLHLLFWITVVSVNLFLYGYNSGRYKEVLIILSSTLPFDILATYLTLYFIIPKFLLKRRYFYFIVIFLFSVFAIVIIEQFINLYMNKILYNGSPRESQYRFWSFYMFRLAINIYTVVSVAAVIKFIRFWGQNLKLKEQLKNQNLQSEIALLKNQINPHFLFNTLNNIDSLINTNSQKASKSIIILSDIMRYMLYDTGVEKISLAKEIDYLKNYVNLQQIRLRNKDFILFTVHGNYENVEISPMLFISFIENAFKHGKKDIKSPGIIISFDISKNYIFFKCINYINKNINKDKTSGIGLTNVKRRLELLYKNNFELITEEKNNKYSVSLSITIN